MKRVNLLLVSLLLSTSNSWASTLNVDLTGGVARWVNAINTGGDEKVPSFWTPTHGLTPTDKWMPGSFVTAPPSSIDVSSGGMPVTLDIEFKGFEYHTGSAGPTIAFGGVTGTVCVGSQWDNVVARVFGTNCVFSNLLETPNAVTPYAFIRPIFSIDDTALAAAFEGKDSGLYRGSVSLSQFYQYYLGDIKTQYIDSQPFVLEIDHTPAFITSIDVSPPEEMKTVYGTDTVSAKTSFVVTATGFFSNGMKVMLKTGEDYFLTGPSLSTIPYSIKCVGACSDELFVDKGAVNLDTIKVDGAETNSINLNIDVEFESVPLDPLAVGYYRDTFTLIFEPDV